MEFENVVEPYELESYHFASRREMSNVRADDAMPLLNEIKEFRRSNALFLVVIGLLVMCVVMMIVILIKM